MKFIRLFFALVLVAGCTGTVTNDDEADSSSPFERTIEPDVSNQQNQPDMTVQQPPSDAGDEPEPTGDMGNVPDMVQEEPFEPGACEGSQLGDDFSVTPIAGTQPIGSMQAAPTMNGGAIVAWRNGADITLTHVDGAGDIVREMSTPGTQIYGVAAHASGSAVLVSRGSDILALVIFDALGNEILDDIVLGDVDHTVTDNEWFGPQIRVGRLIWTGSQWAAYYSVQRLWSDGIAHYGDQLRLYEADGSAFQQVWGWGCSHSMDVRISHNGTGLGAICSSDCFPAKGVHFNHRGGMLWPDESGSDCRGQYGTTIGASIPYEGGFWAAFTAIDQRTSSDVAILKIEGRNPGEPVWLTADAERDTALNAAKFGGDLLVAWNAGTTNQFVVASAEDGAVIEGPLTIANAGLQGSSDFFNFSNGDVGWVQSSETGEIGLARLRVCD